MLTAPKRSLHGKDSQKDRASHHLPKLADVDVVQMYGGSNGHSERGLP